VHARPGDQHEPVSPSDLRERLFRSLGDPARLMIVRRLDVAKMVQQV